MAIDYSVTKSRVVQWVVILLVLAAVAGGYFYYQSRAAVTIKKNTVTFLTTGTSWVVPSDWNNNANTIEAIGGGGGGGGYGGGGGGGGAYAKATNVTLTPGASISYSIGAAGAADSGTDNSTAGGDTSFNTSTVIAKGGSRGVRANDTTPAAGGSAAASTPSSGAFSGGNGGVGHSAWRTGGGGGGAASKLGNGGNGGNGSAGRSPAGGGGGSGGGTAGNSAGAGGNNNVGTGGGAVGSGSGSSSLYNSAGGGGGNNTISTPGGTGGSGQEWSASYGSGGGAGGGATVEGGHSVGGVAGNYGGGGGGGGYDMNGGAGTKGLIVITYNPVKATFNASTNALNTSGLVGHWTFDGADTTTTIATDRGTGGNNGTLTNGPVPTIGKIGQALSFDGTNDYIASTMSSGLSNSFTFSVWLYPTANNLAIQNALSSEVASYSNYWAVLGNGTTDPLLNKGTFYLYDGTNNPGAVTNSALTLNKWTHLVGVRDVSADKLYIYQDGVLQGSGVTDTTTSVPSYSAFNIGRQLNVANRLFPGSIDDVRVYNRALSAAEIQSLYQLGEADTINSSQGDSLTQGLGGYWKMDDGSGTSAADASGNSNTGTLTNGPTWGTGQISGATTFDGTNDYVTVSSSSLIDFNYNQNFAVSTWAKIPTTQVDTTVDTNSIFEKWSQTGGYPYVFRVLNQTHGTVGNRGKVYFARWDGTNGPSVSSPNAMNDNAWHQYIFTKNGSTLALYVDGVLTTTTTDTTTTTTTNSSSLYLGARGSAGSPLYYFTGSLDETRVYNRVLSAEEVSRLYRTTAPQDVTPGLVGFWSFNGKDMSGTTAFDRSGKGNTGTLTNGPAPTIGKIGQALSFDGTNDYVDVGNVGNVQTISYWIKTNNQANGGIELNANQYIDDNAVPEGLVSPTLYVDGVVTTLYGAEKITNGNMEANNTWLTSGTPASQEQSSTIAYRGTYSWKIVTSGGWSGVYQPLALTNGDTYLVSGWFYVSYGAAGASIQQEGGSWTYYGGVGVSTTGSWQYARSYVTSATWVAGTGIRLISDNTAATVYFDDFSVKQVTTRYPITDTNWHHVVVTTGTAVPASAVKIGKGGAAYMNGLIDDVRIYNTALSAAEIASLYNQGR